MHLPLLICLLLTTTQLSAEVVSETVYFLQPDGRSYLLERALRTSAASHRFYVDKTVGREDLRHVEPKEFTWDQDSRDDVNILNFGQGGFTLIFPGRFDSGQLTDGDDGELLFKSWDGRKEANGHFGIWYSPGDFDRFTYTWILPDNIELLGYRANRRGDWVAHNKAVSFYASDVNDLTFELRYRVTPTRPQAGTRREARAVETAVVSPHDSRGCELDCDGDRVANRHDACPDTPQGSTVDRRGCHLTGAQDGDGDGVADTLDLCPGSQQGAHVDRAGCSLDTDKDGVADGIDRCLATPEGSRVDAQGCTVQ